MSKANNLFAGRRAGSIVRLAGYLSLSGLFSTSAILIDANMVGPVGEETLAGLGLSASLYGLFMALLFGLGSAAQILLMRAEGAGDIALFYRRLKALVLAGLGLSLVLVVLFRFNINFLVDHLATTSGIGFAAKHYLGLMVYGLPITAMAYLLSLSFDVQRRPGLELRGYAIEIPLNIILNAFLIYGLFGAPELGIIGAAIATLASQGARLVYLVVLVGREVVAYRREGVFSSPFSGTPEHGQKLLPKSIVLPVMLNVGALIVGTQGYQIAFSQLPYLQFAAIALISPWISVFNVAGRALASAATLSVADLPPNSLVLKKMIGEIWIVLRRLIPELAILFSLVTFLVAIFSWHISSPIRDSFLILVPLGGLLCLVRSLSVCLAAILRASDDPKWVFRVQFLVQWGLGLPLMVFVVLVLEPPYYLAYGLLILEESIRLAILGWRLLRKLGQIG